MAIVIQTEKFGIKIKGAYVRIEQVRHSRWEDGIECVARFYSQKPENGTPAFQDFVFRSPFNTDAGNLYEQGYNHMKSLPEFSGGKDC